MLKMKELFDTNLLKVMLERGYVSRRVQNDLVIYNYKPKAQFDRVWNEVTRQCRGLIVHGVTGQVVARPFEKFFNYAEVADSLPDEPFEVFEKLDGSLGILYPDGFGWAIATRGSFGSDQAIHATALYQQKYSDFEPRPGFTYLFEIIYPSNRIVVDYYGQDDLVLIDVIHTESGSSVFDYMASTWPGPVVQAHYCDSVEDLLRWQRPNCEGFVLKFNNGMRVKVKHDEYVRLHRIVTGVSSKTVWEYMSEGKDFVDLLERVPDEFYDWIIRTRNDLHDQFCALVRQVYREYGKAIAAAHFALDGGMFTVAHDTSEFRKVFAGLVAKSDLRAALFLRLDHRSFEKTVWSRLKPTYERPFTHQSEDAN